MEPRPKSLPPVGFFPGEEPAVDALMAEWAGVAAPAKHPRPSPTAPRHMRAAEERVKCMRESGEWAEATARDFVALFEMLHEEVYGFRPAGMTSEERKRAVFAAGRVLREDFGGDAAAMAEYLRWLWHEREAERERWRRENGREGSPLGYRLVFGVCVNDHRAHLLRRRR